MTIICSLCFLNLFPRILFCFLEWNFLIELHHQSSNRWCNTSLSLYEGHAMVINSQLLWLTFYREGWFLVFLCIEFLLFWTCIWFFTLGNPYPLAPISLSLHIKETNPWGCNISQMLPVELHGYSNISCYYEWMCLSRDGHVLETDSKPQNG